MIQMTADSKTFIALLSMLQATGIAMFLAGKLRASFGISVTAVLLILAVVCGNWQQVESREMLFLLPEIALLAAAVGGCAGRLGVAGWWVVWTANTLMLAFSVYGAFFFRIF